MSDMITKSKFLLFHFSGCVGCPSRSPWFTPMGICVTVTHILTFQRFLTIFNDFYCVKEGSSCAASVFKIVDFKQKTIVVP